MTPQRGDLVRLRNDHTQVAAVELVAGSNCWVRWLYPDNFDVTMARSNAFEVVGRYSGAQ